MTTPNVNKSLSGIFDIELATTDKPIAELKIEAKSNSINSLEAQREYVKSNIVSLLEKGKTALDELTAIATSTESYKDFKVVSEMIKVLVDTNMTLLECEVVHKPAEPTESAAQVTNNTAVFVGSTSELSKYLKKSNTSTNIIENNTD